MPSSNCRRFFRVIVVVAVSLVCGNLLPRLHAADEAAPLRVMTFNIRFGTAKDGENHWEKRKEFLVETVKAFDPDLLGTQECLAFQRDYLVEQLPGREPFSIGRDDGSEKGEMAAILFRKERFEKLDGGHFWLSEAPEKPGSKSWDSSLPRIVTWLKLRDRKNAGTPPFVYFNTHFDHRGKEARQNSARLMRQRIDALGPGIPVVVTGDFNCDEGSDPYRALFQVVQGEPVRLIDAFRSAHKTRGRNEGTFSGFQANRSGGPRIDWIGCSPEWEVLSSEIDRTERDGRTPSDHVPVTAVLRLRKN
ncbi:MAG: endonuclease/exonuclease/phosphatase family protein [Planctomycetaceae bacterium]